MNLNHWAAGPLTMLVLAGLLVELGAAWLAPVGAFGILFSLVWLAVRYVSWKPTRESEQRQKRGDLQ